MEEDFPGQRPEQARLPTETQFGHLLIDSCSEDKLWMMRGFRTRDICFPIPAEQSCVVWHSVSHQGCPPYGYQRCGL